MVIIILSHLQTILFIHGIITILLLVMQIIIAHVDAAVGSDADKQFIKAQALTFRAYAYSQLIQLYSYRWADTNGGATNGVILRVR